MAEEKHDIYGLLGNLKIENDFEDIAINLRNTLFERILKRAKEQGNDFPPTQCIFIMIANEDGVDFELRPYPRMRCLTATDIAEMVEEKNADVPMYFNRK